MEPPVPVPQSAIDDVKRALPNYASLSIDQGTEILRQAALKKYAAAAQELQSQITQAQEELTSRKVNRPPTGRRPSNIYSKYRRSRARSSSRSADNCRRKLPH